MTKALKLHLRRWQALAALFGRHDRPGMALRALIEYDGKQVTVTRFAWRKDGR